MLLAAALAASVIGAGFSAYALTHNVLISFGIGMVSALIFLYILKVSR